MRLGRLALGLLIAGCSLCAPGPLRAQGGARPDTTGPREALRLYLDCSGFYCDSDFYRTEIDFVSHVRDRQVADVHLLVTRQPTGGGGMEYTLNFHGQRRFAGQDDTLRYDSPQAATEDEIRRGLVRVMELGLVPYALATPAGEGLNVSYEAPDRAEPAAAAVHDPWNYWTFTTGLNGFFNGESRYSSYNLFGSFLASRVTEAWKLRFSANQSRSHSRFDLGDGQIVTSDQRSSGLNGLVVRSLGPHLSAGARATAEQSTFYNEDLRLRFAPAVEYDLFPYAESTRRQLTFQYSVGANYFDYTEKTIFGKTSESLVGHDLMASLNLKQRWGSVEVSAQGSQYLQEPERYQAQLFSDLEVRLVKGLSLNLFGNLAYIRDQIYLPAGDATPEEVLLRLRQLDTSYQYFASIGLSYRFGSIYNNVVNPRFDSGRGGITIIR